MGVRPVCAAAAVLRCYIMRAVKAQGVPLPHQRCLGCSGVMHSVRGMRVGCCVSRAARLLSSLQAHLCSLPQPLAVCSAWVKRWRRRGRGWTRCTSAQRRRWAASGT